MGRNKIAKQRMRRRAWGIISTTSGAEPPMASATRRRFSSPGLKSMPIVALKVAGFNLLTVLSGSMEPAYHVGSLIFVKNVDVNTLKENDVITFMADEDTIVTHRIYSVLNEVGDDGSTTLKFRTKGDANTATDASLVDYRNVIGTPVLSIPYLGYLANFIQRPPGIYIALVFATVLVVFAFAPKNRKERSSEKP